MTNISIIKQDFPKYFEILSCMAFLNGENISHDLIQALFGNDSEEDIQSSLNNLAEKSLIIDNNDSVFIEQSKQNEIIELIDNETKINIINNIVYTLNNLLTDDDIQDLRITHEIKTLDLFKHVVKIHQIYWSFTYKSSYSAELVKKLGSLNEDYFLKYEDALNNYNDVLTIYESILPANDISIPDIYNNIGAVYAKLGANDKALNYYNQALSLYEGC